MVILCDNDTPGILHAAKQFVLHNNNADALHVSE